MNLKSNLFCSNFPHTNLDTFFYLILTVIPESGTGKFKWLHGITLNVVSTQTNAALGKKRTIEKHGTISSSMFRNFSNPRYYRSQSLPGSVNQEDAVVVIYFPPMTALLHSVASTAGY